MPDRGPELDDVVRGLLSADGWAYASALPVEAGWPVRDGALHYYGTSDATSWFLVLLDATGDTALQAELAAAVTAAGDWLERALTVGGGLLRGGPRRYPGGLAQLGWRVALRQLDRLGWAAPARDPATAERVRSGVLGALDELGRYPELYAVDRDGRPGPVPLANRVQAWTVGAVLAWHGNWDGGVTPDPDAAAVTAPPVRNMPT